MRFVAIVALGYLLLAVLGGMAAVWPELGTLPDVLALVSVYMGMTSRDRATPAVLSAVVLGYIADLMLGSPKGVCAFVAGVVCFAGHLAQGRFLVRGPIMSMLFGAITALLAGSLASVVRVAVDGDGRGALSLLLGVVVTGLFAPIVFRLCARVEGRRRYRDQGMLEGVIR